MMDGWYLIVISVINILISSGYYCQGNFRFVSEPQDVCIEAGMDAFFPCVIWDIRTNVTVVPTWNISSPDSGGQYELYHPRELPAAYFNNGSGLIVINPTIQFDGSSFACCYQTFSSDTEQPFREVCSSSGVLHIPLADCPEPTLQTPIRHPHLRDLSIDRINETTLEFTLSWTELPRGAERCCHFEILITSVDECDSANNSEYYVSNNAQDCMIISGCTEECIIQIRVVCKPDSEITVEGIPFCYHVDTSSFLNISMTYHDVERHSDRDIRVTNRICSTVIYNGTTHYIYPQYHVNYMMATGEVFFENNTYFYSLTNISTDTVLLEYCNNIVSMCHGCTNFGGWKILSRSLAIVEDPTIPVTVGSTTVTVDNRSTISPSYIYELSIIFTVFACSVTV